jgi:transglutaminase-like putative cysteine protease
MRTRRRRGRLPDRRRAAGGKAAGDAAAFAPSVTVQSTDATIRALARTILTTCLLAPTDGALSSGWSAIFARRQPTSSRLDVLQSKRAECQGQTYLYAALARAAGIPTRVANGLVYSPEHEGFLYHTWAESLVDGSWQAVDPTFDQRRADATHLALVYGETLADLLPLVEWVGKTRIRVLEAER